MPHDSAKSRPGSNELRSRPVSSPEACTAGPLADAAREAAHAALDVIEMRLPADADLRLECAREVGRLLARGVLARLSP